MRFGLLGIAIVTAACHGAFVGGQPAPNGEIVPITRFDDRVAGVAQTSGFDQPARLVVRDTSAWRQAWMRMNARFFPQPPLPSVDFQRETVLIAAMGARANGGFEIHLDSALRRADTIEVVVKSVAPGDGCMVSASYTQPVDVAKIPALPLPVRFREQMATLSCRP